MIQKQALSYSRPEFEFFLFPVPKYFISLTGFHGGQNTNQSVADPIVLNNFKGLLLLICLGRRKIDNRAILPVSLRTGGFFQLFAFIQKHFTAIFQPNPCIPKKAHHSTFDCQSSQRAAQNQTVETAKMPDDLFFILCYKTVHGVLLGVGGCWHFQQYPSCDAISILFFRRLRKTCESNQSEIKGLFGCGFAAL
jgi:hypothetical protein